MKRKKLEFETGFDPAQCIAMRKFLISQVGEALEEDLSSGGDEGTHYWLINIYFI